MGLLRRDPATGEYYNAMAAFAATEQWYYKRRLVPFGEFFPVPAAVRDWMRLMNLPYSDFAAGRRGPGAARGGRRDARAHHLLRGRLCRRSSWRWRDAPTLLVNVTNDAWFGDSTAPHQHLDISRMRSLETGRPMLRATNDGVTALIAHDGTLLGTLPQFEPGVLTGTVEPRDRPRRRTCASATGRSWCCRCWPSRSAWRGRGGARRRGRRDERARRRA